METVPLFVRMITGYRKDQEISLPANEAHVAYYLFLNPQERAVFSTGDAVQGADIRAIKPDYNATMGWNSTHVVDDDDMVEVCRAGVDVRMRKLLSFASEVARRCTPQDLATPLVVLKQKYTQMGTTPHHILSAKTNHEKNQIPASV